MGMLGGTVLSTTDQPCGEIGILTVPLALLGLGLLVVIVLGIVSIVTALGLTGPVLASMRRLLRRPPADRGDSPGPGGVAEVAHLLDPAGRRGQPAPDRADHGRRGGLAGS